MTHSNTNPRSGQYLTHAHSHITRAVAVMESFFGLVRPHQHGPQPGAIIGDGDRKSWDPRGSMIWDNFSIFRTDCAILTSYIHAPVVVSRVVSHVAGSMQDSLADFSQRWQGIKNQGSSTYFYAPS